MEIIDNSDTLTSEQAREILRKIIRLCRDQAKAHTPDLNLWAETWCILVKDHAMDIASDNEMYSMARKKD